MELSAGHILLLTQQTENLHGLEFLLEGLRCAVEIVTTPDQAVDRVHHLPCLVILQGNCRSWSQKLVHTLRTIADA